MDDDDGARNYYNNNIFHGDGYATSMTFSPDRWFIVSGYVENIILIVCIHTQLPINKPIKPLKYIREYIISLEYSEDGRYIVSLSTDNNIRIYDAVGRQIGEPFLYHNGCGSVGFSDDFKHIIEYSQDTSHIFCDNPIMVYKSYLKPYLITNLIGIVIRYI